MGQSIYQLLQPSGTMLASVLLMFLITCSQSSERIRRADMKWGNKNLTIDETRRDTYKQFHPSAHANDSSLMSNFGGEKKQLLAVCS